MQKLANVKHDLCICPSVCEFDTVILSFGFTQRHLYGGQMSFRLSWPNLDPQKVTQSQAGVVIEIEVSCLTYFEF